jgi:hypothetical protein
MSRLTHVVDIGANPIEGALPYKPLLDAHLLGLDRKLVIMALRSYCRGRNYLSAPRRRRRIGLTAKPAAS